MIERKDILSIPFLKKTAFTGSYRGMRFRLAQIKEEEKVYLELAAWKGPYAYSATPQDKMLKKETEFSENGIQEGIDWLNQTWEADAKEFEQSASLW